GRCDEQVKIRGFRIELGEIAAQLSSLEEVDSAAVVVHEQGAEKRLVAYVVPVSKQLKALLTDEQTIDDNFIQQVREKLQARLPEHMIPAVFMLLPDLPLTTNGKLDTKTLPSPELSAQQNYVAATTDIEKQLCDIWQMVLGVELVGREDNFFNLGGDSIISISMVAALRASGFDVSVRDIFEHSSVKKLASFVAERLLDKQVQAMEPFALLTQEERSGYEASELCTLIEDAYPLSQLQSGMVFHTQKSGFDGVYHDIMSDHLRCRWDEQAFCRSLLMVVAAHPLLRSGFKLTGERPLQHVFREVELPLLVEDIQHMNEQDQQEYLDAWRQMRRHHEFDWENGPLYQVNVFLRSVQTFELVVSFHHAILDGWSLATLNTQLFGHYLAQLTGETPADVAVERIYREFIALELESLSDTDAKARFTQMLADSPVEQLPLKVGVSRTQQREQGTHLVPELALHSVPLAALAQRLNVPLQSVLLAVHFKVLSQLSGQDEVLSCVTHNGRPEVQGAQSGLGLFLNSLPVGMRLPQGSWAKLIESVAEVSRGLLPYRRYPLSMIQKETGREFGEVTFNYTHFHVYNSLELGDESEVARLGGSGFEQTNFDFHVDISRSVDGGDHLQLALHFNRHLYDAEQIAMIGRCYLKAVALCLADVSASHAVSLLDDEALTDLTALE
ncbi:condensation domain-containing protein, partial [Rheinheimera soli]